MMYIHFRIGTQIISAPRKTTRRGVNLLLILSFGLAGMLVSPSILCQTDPAVENQSQTPQQGQTQQQGLTQQQGQAQRTDGQPADQKPASAAQIISILQQDGCTLIRK